jgi:hypothetical protein
MLMILDHLMVKEAAAPHREKAARGWLEETTNCSNTIDSSD